MIKILRWSAICIFILGLVGCTSANNFEKSNEGDTVGGFVTEGDSVTDNIGEMTKTKDVTELNIIKTTGNFEVAVVGASMGTLKVSDDYLHLFNLNEEVNILRLDLQIEHTSDGDEYLDFDKAILDFGVAGGYYTADAFLTSYFANNSIYNVFSGSESREVGLYFFSATKDFRNVKSAKLYMNAPYKINNEIEQTGSELVFDITLQ